MWFTTESWYLNHISLQLIKKLCGGSESGQLDSALFSPVRNLQPTQMLLLQGGAVVAETRSKNASTVTISRLWLSTIFIFPNLDDKHYGSQSFSDVKVLLARHCQTTWSCISKISNFRTTKPVELEHGNLCCFSLICVHFGRSAIRPVRRWMTNWVCDLASGLEVIGQCHLPSFSPHRDPQTHKLAFVLMDVICCVLQKGLSKNNIFSSEMDISPVYQSIFVSAGNAWGID